MIFFSLLVLSCGVFLVLFDCSCRPCHKLGGIGIIGGEAVSII